MKVKLTISRWRFICVVVLVSALPIMLVWHLANLQVIPGNDKDFRFLQTAGEARTLRRENINAYRGVITDRHGELLAVSTSVKSLYVNPQEIDPEEIDVLAQALSLKKDELVERLKKYSQKKFMYLARHLPPHQADEVSRLHLSGVYAEEEFQRFYPAGEVAAHIVGFTNIDDKGQEGVELGFDQWLAGEQGSKYLIKDLKGNVVKDLGLQQAPRSGNDLRLSIDLRLQYLAYKELQKAIFSQGAKSGSLVMMDPATGDILAVVNQPSYNPNNRERVNPSQLRNRAFTDVFEPGSTMKPFTVMAALESGKFDENYSVDTSPGHIFIGDKLIPDPVNYGILSMGRIISKSSQVGISKLALQMDPNQIREMYFKSGLGQSTGSGFPGESVGVLPNRSKWAPIEQATFSYGYGLNVNAVQLAQAYSVIASGGEFKPARIVLNDAEVRSQQVVKRSVANKVIAMLKTVPEKGGTATRAQIESYPVAGKTGTAHKVRELGYADDKYIALFAGFAPADKPEIVAVIIINEPPSDGAYSGGKAAAPVFAQVVEKALRVMRVPPKYSESESIVALGDRQ